MDEKLVRSLAEPLPVSKRWWTVYVLSAAAFGVAFGCFLVIERDVVVGLPLVATAHAVAMALVYGLLAFLFFTQARGDTQFGYLILGFTFGFAGMLWAWFPYFFPNGLAYSVPAASVVGTENSAAALYLINRWSVLVGVGVGGVAISRADVFSRRAAPRIAWAVLAMALTSGAMLAWAAAGVPGVPSLLVSQERPTEAMIVTTLAVLVTAIVVLMVLARACQSGSLISRWLLTVGFLQFLEACATPFAQRYSANWLAARWLSLIGSLVLLFTLLWQLNRIQQATAKAADLDDLTGALSRSSFVRVITEHLSTPANLRPGSGVMWVDLDQFRLLNAAVGSAEGDRFLRGCLDRLNAFTPSRGLVARLGGDEFALLTRAQSPANLIECGMQISEQMAEPFDVQEGTVASSASIGCVWIDDSADSAEEVLRRSYAAMLAAKQGGGGTAQIYSPALDAVAEAEMHWRHRLAVAIRDEAFENAYQPIFNTTSGAVVAVEALIRLREGEALINAGEFIAQAEASGQIIGIGRIGLQCLIDDLPQLLDASPDTPLAVSLNLSVRQLTDPVVIGMLLKPPLHTFAASLVVEVTESFEFSASSLAHENLQLLVRAGYRIAIDDFGSGFSNFVQLEEIGRHIIKLDRSLIVRAGTREPSSLSVLSAALAVARSLTSEVLAEGVETADEAAVVQEMGIHLVQGYRFARPMTLAEVVAFVASTNAQIVETTHS